MVTILKEFAQNMKPATLQKLRLDYSKASALQKVGYVLGVELNDSKVVDSKLKVILI